MFLLIRPFQIHKLIKYIYENNIPIAKVYGDIIKTDNGYETTGVNRTGCMFCMYGVHLEEHPNRFEKMRDTHPKQYDYCMNGGSYDSDGIWKPDKNGLGMKHVIDTLNSLYGEDFIKY